MFEDNRQDELATFGTPLQPQPRPDTAGANVPPVLGGHPPAAGPGAAMSFAEGGAIDDSGDPVDGGSEEITSNAGVPDPTTDSVTNALQMVNEAMMYGRKKAGLPTDDAAIQEDDGSGAEEDIPSFAEGGAVEDDGAAPAVETAGGAQDVQPQDDPPQGSAPEPAQTGAGLPVAFSEPPPQAGAIDTGEGNVLQPVGSGQNAPHQLLRRGANAIMDYLRGADAATPQEVQALKGPEAAVGGSPDADNVLAIAKAAQAGGPEAAFKVLQYNRQRYDAYMSHAKAAVTGTPERPADLRAAAESATRAYQYMPDGTSARFSAGPNGITATVTPWGKPQVNHQLTPEQFARFTNVSKEGQFDQVYEKGGAASVLAEIAKAPAGKSAAPAATGAAPAPAASAAPSPDTRGWHSPSNPKLNKNARPATGGNTPAQDAQFALENSRAYRNAHEGGHERGGVLPNGDVKMGYDVTMVRASDGYKNKFPETFRRSQQGQERINPAFRAPSDSDTNDVRSQRAFPGIGQSTQRAKYRDQLDQEEAKAENKLAVAKATGGSRTDAARIGADARRDVEGTRGQNQLAVQEKKNEGWKYASDTRRAAAQIAADQKAAHDGNVDARARIESARKAIATKRMTAGTLSPEDEALEKQLVSQAQAPGQAKAPPAAQRPQAQPQGQAPQAQAAPSPGAPPVQGARFFNGSWYTRGPNGEAVPYRQ